MNVPEKISMKSESFGDGRNGYAVQTRINEEYGVRLTVTREQYGKEFVESWSAGGLPGQEFEDYASLREAMIGIEDSKINTDEFDSLWEQAQAAKKERAEKMPDEKSAIKQMFEAYQRLEELGWSNAIYCPKDGTMFSAIEAGSTGVHECNYHGKWPTGGWSIYDGDVWPASPILWRPRKDDDPNIDNGPCIPADIEGFLGDQP